MKAYHRAIGHANKFAGVHRVPINKHDYGRVLTQKERSEWADKLERIMDRAPYGRKFTLDDIGETI